ncbi:MAG: hypothetical protein KDK36_05080 [Leptospiraceae bacterium]|nr:hypothetical protein [Leptospiraceae bacterium]
MTKIIASLICFLVLGINLYIYSNTKKKIGKYNSNPPFIILDHTNSLKKNQNSKIKYLLDGNVSTTWTKELPKPENGWKFDIDLELRLTHIFNGEKYIERKFSNIEIIACSEKKVNWEFEVYLREAINVDAELRWRSDNVLLNQVVEVGKEKISFELPEYKLGDSKSFPADNIRILEIRGRSKEIACCFSEIILK